MDNIIETIKSNDLVKILLIVGLVYFLMTYMKGSKKEKLENVDAPAAPVVNQAPLELPANQPTMTFSPANMPNADAQQKQIDDVVAGQQKLTADDLLPKYDDANAFAKENPVSKLLKEQNFLVSGFHAGINTVMQSNKIPYLDLRVLPPIPKENVGPWNQSSYEQSPASLRRGLEIL
jgi:hypothetical protein